MKKYNHHFLFGKRNFQLVLIGLVVMAVGMILMVGGDPTKYQTEIIYGFRTTVLAPILVLVGLGIQGFAIFTKPTASDVWKAQSDMNTATEVEDKLVSRRKSRKKSRT